MVLSSLLAGVASTLSMLQPAIAFLEEGFGLKRRASVALLGLATLAGSSLVIYFSGNMTVLDTMDYWVGTFLLYVLAAIQVIVFVWVIGIDEGFREMNLGAQMRMPRIFKIIIQYVTPAYLFIVFGAWLLQNASGRVAEIVENPVARATVMGMMGFWILLLILVFFAGRVWNRTGRGMREIES